MSSVSKKTLEELAHYLSGFTLKEIKGFFYSADFPPLPKAYVLPPTGQRRSLVTEYLESIDPVNQLDGEKIHKLCEYVLITLSDDIEDHSNVTKVEEAERTFNNLLRWLRRDGFDFENGRLAAVTTAIHDADIKVPPPPVPPRQAVAEPVITESPATPPEHPTAFVSYSWDGDVHKRWVQDLAAKLRSHGVDVKLDRWEVARGDQLPHFMETGVRTNDFVLIVLTRNYKKKSDSRQGGVGYESNVMTAEMFAGKDPRKFIPVLREGTWDEASPSWLSGKVGVDLRGNPYSEQQFTDLLETVHGMREKAPPLGPLPAKRIVVKEQVTFTPPSPPQTNEPIRIVNIIASEVGTPRNDGTRGSALYAVPFQLSRRPSTEWIEHFIRTWERPPSWSTRHRPGIARVEGDRLILDGTTIEEVADVHRDTLKVVLEKVNQDIAEHEQRQRQLADRQAEELRQHKQSVEDAAKKISFD